MESAIEKEGISLERFNQMIDQANQDNALKQQISEPTQKLGGQLNP